MAGPQLVGRYGELIGAVLPAISHASRDVRQVWGRGGLAPGLGCRDSGPRAAGRRPRKQGRAAGGGPVVFGLNGAGSG